jgi:hypothetical protein
MPGLIWSPAALKDVQRLYRFLAPKNLDTVIVLAVRHQKEAGFSWLVEIKAPKIELKLRPMSCLRSLITLTSWIITYKLVDTY